MARKIRIQFEGAIYHVTIRGVERRRILSGQYGCEARAVAALLLIREADLTQREVARQLGMGTGSAVCRQIARLKSLLPADRDLADRLERIQGELNTKIIGQ